jgi:hypothetical protein
MSSMIFNSKMTQVFKIHEENKKKIHGFFFVFETSLLLVDVLNTLVELRERKTHN